MAKSIIVDSVCETRLKLIDGPQAGAEILVPSGVTALSRDRGGLSFVGAEGAQGALIRDALTPFLGPLFQHDGVKRRLGRRGVIAMGALRADVTTKPTVGARIGLGAVAALCLGALIALSPAFGVVGAPTALAAGSKAADAAPPNQRAANEAALLRLVEALRSAGLSDKIAARVGREDETLIAEGVIGPEDLPAWRAVLATFDAQAAPVFLLNAVQVEARSVVVPFKVVGLSADSGALRIADGQRFEVGDTLPGGWRLETIDADGAEIRRGSDVIRLSL